MRFLRGDVWAVFRSSCFPACVALPSFHNHRSVPSLRGEVLGPLRGQGIRIALASCLSLLCAGMAVASPAATEDDARAWLEKMSRAVHQYNYDGVFIYLRGSQMQSIRVIHSVEGGKERERMVLLTGLQREVLRADDKITYIVPKNRSLVLERRRGHPQSGFALISPHHIDKLVACYDVSLAGRDRIAGRETQRLVIRPRDRFRYGYRLWLDRETGLLLKTVLLNRKGNHSEQFMFATLRYLDRVPPALLEPEVEGNEYVFFRDRPDNRESLQAATRWRAGRLPFGFELSTHRRYTTAGTRDDMEQLVYSDGLSSVSVFIEPLKSGQEPLRGSSNLGAVNAYGTIHDDFQVIALGEVPPATVEQIATSIYRGQEKGQK